MTDHELEDLLEQSDSEATKGNYTASLHLAEQALVYAKAYKREAFTVNVLNSLGNIHESLGNFDKSLLYYSEALDYYTERNLRSGIAGISGNIGLVYSYLGQYEKALEYYTRAITLHRELKEDAHTARVIGNIGLIYYFLKSYDQALEYFTIALESHEKLGNKLFIANVACNIGIVYTATQQYDKALEYTHRALSVFQELGSQNGIAVMFGELAAINADLGNFETSWEYFRQSLDIHRTLNEKYDVARVQGNIAGLFANQQWNGYSLETAVEWYERAIEGAREVGAKYLAATFHHALSELYQEKGNYREELRHFKEYHRIEKEVFNDESDKRLKNLQIIHEVEQTKKQAEFLRLENEKMKHEQDLQTKHLTTLTMSLVQQNEFLRTLRNELLRLADTVDAHRESPLKDIAKRVKKQSQAQEEWSAFEAQFSLLHADFIQRLSEKFPTLSPTELKVCALLRIGLSTKEISTLLFVTLRCVETHRYRIRKKMNVEGKDNLILILHSL